MMETIFFPKASDLQNVLQVLFDYMSFSWNGEYIQKKHNVLIPVIDWNVATKLTLEDLLWWITVHGFCQFYLFCVTAQKNEVFPKGFLLGHIYWRNP